MKKTSKKTNKMNVQITKEKLLTDLDKLNTITDIPILYLSNYFKDLRDRVDIEFAPKQQELQNDKEKKNELDELWKQMITKIDLFEKSCIRKTYDLNVNKIRINEIEEILNSEQLIDLKKLQDEIENEETNLLQNLFQNKSILFRKYDQDKVQSKIIDGQLIVLFHEYISQKTIDER
jgi:hypothetical protein